MFVSLEVSVAALAVAFLSVTLAVAHDASQALWRNVTFAVLLFVLLAVSDLLPTLVKVRCLVHWYAVVTIWRNLVRLGPRDLLVIARHRE